MKANDELANKKREGFFCTVDKTAFALAKKERETFFKQQQELEILRLHSVKSIQ